MTKQRAGYIRGKNGRVVGFSHNPELVSQAPSAISTAALDMEYKTPIKWLVGVGVHADGTVDRFATVNGVFQKVATIPPEPET